jgi:peptidoglycan L-alanyl-D-glutamate endopeptidase CwlK
MPVTLTSRDLSRLKGVHPDLVRVVKRLADLSGIQFTVLEGVRTVERQRELVKAGASKTMNSRHIPAKNGFGHAVDIAPMLNGKITWDWPLYHKLAPLMKQAAKKEAVAIEWGGDWKSFADGPHWQLTWAAYPGK